MSDIIINIHRSSRKVPTILVGFSWNLERSPQIFEITQISNFMEIHPVGAELFHMDRQMDRQADKTKLTAVFHNFARVPKKDIKYKLLL